MLPSYATYFLGDKKPQNSAPPDNTEELLKKHSLDFSLESYLREPTRRAYLIEESTPDYPQIVGFALLHQATIDPSSNWSIGEFFVQKAFQHRGVGKAAAQQLWNLLPGKWEISIHPRNHQALQFWQKTINDYNGGIYSQKSVIIEYDLEYPERTLLTLRTSFSQNQNS